MGPRMPYLAGVAGRALRGAGVIGRCDGRGHRGCAAR